MSVTKAAQANHDKLFPGHQSTLTVTDPQFVELSGNFAFDEVIAHGDLSTQTRPKVILASLIAMQTVNEYKVMLGGALNVGITPVEVKGSSTRPCPTWASRGPSTSCTPPTRSCKAGACHCR